MTTTRSMNLNQAVMIMLNSGGRKDLTKSWGTDNQLQGAYGKVRTQVDDRQVQLRRWGGYYSVEPHVQPAQTLPDAAGRRV